MVISVNEFVACVRPGLTIFKNSTSKQGKLYYIFFPIYMFVSVSTHIYLAFADATSCAAIRHGIEAVLLYTVVQCSACTERNSQDYSSSFPAAKIFRPRYVPDTSTTQRLLCLPSHRAWLPGVCALSRVLAVPALKPHFHTRFNQVCEVYTVSSSAAGFPL